MPPRSLRDKSLDCRLTIRLPADERDTIAADAHVAGLTMSEIVRRRYFGRPISAAVDLITVRELRRIGGLLKKVHTDSKGAYSIMTATALNKIVDCIDRIATDSAYSGE